MEQKLSLAELRRRVIKNHTNAPRINRAQKVATKTKFTQGQSLVSLTNKWTLDAVVTGWIEEHKDRVRYVPQAGKWAVWNKHVWAWDETGQVRELVKEYGRQYILLAHEEKDKDQKSIMKRWGTLLTSPKGITEALNLAQTDAVLVASLQDFDADMYTLNTPSGVVDLVTGESAPATPQELVRRSTTVTPDASCSTEKYDKLLAEAFLGSPELSEYFDTMMGITLVRAQDEQVFLYMHGAAGSGKGTLMNIAQDILGIGDNGYAAYVDSGLFVKSAHQAHPTELMQFMGARMVVSSEITEGQKMDTGKLKKTTGGDKITGRYMGKDFVTFDATHTLWLMANHRLQVPHDDKGVWRRLRVIPFEFAKNEGEYISGLQRIIYEEEGPGILARWIAKAQQYFEQGYHTPQVVMDAREEYKTEQDTIAEWLELSCDTDDPEAFAIGASLRESYVKWCKQENKIAVGTKQFTQELEQKGFIRHRKLEQLGANRSVHRGFKGLSLAHGNSLSY